MRESPLNGVLHGEYWVDDECIKVFDIPTVVIDVGLDTVLNITFSTNSEQL